MTSDYFRDCVNAMSADKAGFPHKGYVLPPDLDERVGRLQPQHADYSRLIPDYGKYFMSESSGFHPGDDTLPPWISRND